MLETKRKLGEYHPKALTDMGNLATTYFEVVVMEKRTQVLGDNHPETVMIMGSLAVTYHNQGCLDDVGALEAVPLEKRKLALGNNHPDTDTYRGQGVRRLIWWSCWRRVSVGWETTIYYRRHREYGESCSHVLDLGPLEGGGGISCGSVGKDEGEDHPNRRGNGYLETNILTPSRTWGVLHARIDARADWRMWRRSR